MKLRNSVSVLLLSWFWFCLSPVSIEANVYRVNFPAKDGIELSGVVGKAENERARMILVHGFQSHSEWYIHSGLLEDLSKNGITTLVYDRRGSGRSEGLRGHADSSQDFFNDFESALDILNRESLSKLPLHVFANCFGARVILPYLHSLGEKMSVFTSVILTSPSTDMAEKTELSAAQKLQIGFHSRNPKWRFKSPLKDSYFSSDPDVQAWIHDDPYALRSMTIGFAKATKQLTEIMLTSLPKLPIPFLVVLGKNDEMVENDKIRERFFDAFPYRVMNSGPLTEEHDGFLEKWANDKKYQGLISELDTDHAMDMGQAHSLFVQTLTHWILGTAP